MDDRYAIALNTLEEIAKRGPIEGYNSAEALRLRLVLTQSMARRALELIAEIGRTGTLPPVED